MMTKTSMGRRSVLYILYACYWCKWSLRRIKVDLHLSQLHLCFPQNIACIASQPITQACQKVWNKDVLKILLWGLKPKHRVESLMNTWIQKQEKQHWLCCLHPMEKCVYISCALTENKLPIHWILDLHVKLLLQGGGKCRRKEWSDFLCCSPHCWVCRVMLQRICIRLHITQSRTIHQIKGQKFWGNWSWSVRNEICHRYYWSQIQALLFSSYKRRVPDTWAMISFSDRQIRVPFH